MLAVVVLGVWFHGDWTLLPLILAGAVLFLAGGIIGVAGVVVLGGSRTPFPCPPAGARLVQRGVYAWMRHPLYTSVMLASFGWALIWQSWPAGLAAVVLAVFYDAKARHEEHWLREAFPEYPDYQKRVRRFIPGIY